MLKDENDLITQMPYVSGERLKQRSETCFILTTVWEYQHATFLSCLQLETCAEAAELIDSFFPEAPFHIV